MFFSFCEWILCKIDIFYSSNIETTMSNHDCLKSLTDVTATSSLLHSTHQLPLQHLNCYTSVSQPSRYNPSVRTWNEFGDTGSRGNFSWRKFLFAWSQTDKKIERGIARKQTTRFGSEPKTVHKEIKINLGENRNWINRLETENRRE